jgi:branched-chain amino acid transport system ATP-binding protein
VSRRVILEAADLHTYYGESHVLQGVSLAVAQGEVVALLGRNGSGKTTTVRSIIGFTPPRRGTVRFDGARIDRLPAYRIARTGIGLVPQGRRVFPTLTVRENLLLAARAGGPGGWTLERVYREFSRLAERERQLAGTLSGGEQQMLAIGRALLTNARLLLMDEPSEGLAPPVIRELGRVLAGLRGSALSILLVEQNLGLALGVADRAYVLNKGRVVYEGTPVALRADVVVKRAYLGV